MAGYGDILDSFISGQNQALANQMDMARLRETQNQNRLAQSNFRQQFAADERQRARSNQYNQGILETQQNADRRAQVEADRNIADSDRQQNIAMAIQSLDFTKENWTPEDALDPSKEGGWRALNNIPEVRELLGGEIRLAVIPGSEDREGGPLYSFQVFNDKTGTTGPLTTLRGNQKDEFVMFHDRDGVTQELNNIKNLVRAQLGVDPRYITDSTVSLMQQGANAEAAATQAIPEVKPFGSAAINADRMGTSAAAQDSIPGLGPIGTGSPYTGAVAQGNAAAAVNTPASTANATQTNTSAPAALGQIDQDIAALRKVRDMYARGSAGVAQGPGGMYGGVNAQPGPRVQEVDDEIARLEQQKAQMLGAPAASTVSAAGPVNAATQTANTSATVQPVVNNTVAGTAGGAPLGYGSEERIARSAAALAQPFLDQANGAREAFNAASSYRGIVPTAQQLESVNFSRRNQNLTDAQASNLLSDGDTTGARTARTQSRMTESRSIMNNAADNARQVVTNIQDNNKEVVKTWLTEQAGIRKKQMEIEADITKTGDANTRKAYTFLNDTIAPNVMDQLQIPENQRAQLTGVVTNVWATLPDLPGPNGTKISLRSNDAGQQQRIATGVAKAYNELNAYNDGAQLKPYGFIKWMQDVVTPDILRDWSRTDFNTAELHGVAFTAYAMSGLDPRTFADVVLEPMSAAKGRVSPTAFKKLMGSIMLFEQSQGRAPTEDDIRRLVTLTTGEG